MLKTLQEACEEYGIRYRAALYRLKSEGYIRSNAQYDGLLPDYNNKATADLFRSRDKDFYVPTPTGQINKKRSIVTVTDAGIELVVKRCADLKKPDPQEQAAS